jgi:hypothetical protein
MKENKTNSIMTLWKTLYKVPLMLGVVILIVVASGEQDN